MVVSFVKNVFQGSFDMLKISFFVCPSVRYLHKKLDVCFETS